MYQNTNSSLQFLTATDTNRKKFLIDLLHLEHYISLFELFKEESRRTSMTLGSIEAKTATIEKWLTDNKLSDTNILPLSEISIETIEDEQELATLMIEIKNISEKNRKISQNNTYKDMLAKIDIEKAQSCNKTLQSYDNLQSEVGKLSQAAAGSKRLSCLMIARASETGRSSWNSAKTSPLAMAPRSSASSLRLPSCSSTARANARLSLSADRRIVWVCARADCLGVAGDRRRRPGSPGRRTSCSPGAGRRDPAAARLRPEVRPPS